MLSYLIQQNTEVLIPILVLIFFFAIILTVTAWIFRPGSSQKYKYIAQTAIAKERGPQ